MKKITIAIPFQQHSFRTAKGLIKYNMLNKYFTSVYNDEKGIYKILKFVLSEDLIKRMKGRADKEISPYVIRISSFYGLLYLAAFRIEFLKKYVPNIRNILLKSFGKKTVKECYKINSQFIITYDTQSYDIFEEISKKQYSIIKILDMASTSALTIRRIIDEEVKKNYPFSNSLKRHKIAYNDQQCSIYKKEIDLADYLLVPSNFVKESLKEIGVSEEKIFYLPHGVDINMFSPNYKKLNLNARLTFLFVGRVEAAKGIYYLLEAFKQLQTLKIKLLVVGDTMGQLEELKKYTSNVEFVGLKRRDEMPEYYNKADVFILSSLWEGSSLSLLEALAMGLPAIASKYSCAPEVIIEGEEGFVIEPRDIVELKKRIIWFYNNKERIPEMSKKARTKVEEYTWENYENNISKIIKKIMYK